MKKIFSLVALVLVFILSSCSIMNNNVKETKEEETTVEASPSETGISEEEKKAERVAYYKTQYLTDNCFADAIYPYKYVAVTDTVVAVISELVVDKFTVFEKRNITSITYAEFPGIGTTITLKDASGTSEAFNLSDVDTLLFKESMNDVDLHN